MSSALLRASLAYLTRHPWQLVLSLLGVSIGVAVIIAVDLANSSARNSFLLSMDAITGSATHQVIGGSEGVAESAYVDLRTVHGLDAVAPVVEGEGRIANQDFEILGIDLFAEAAMQRFSSGVTGSPSLFSDWLIVPGAIALSETRAKVLGLGVGDDVEIIVQGRAQAAKVIGLFDSGEAPSLESILLTDISTAQEWLGMSGFLTRIDVRAGVDGEPDADAIAALLPIGTRLLSSERRTQSTLDLSAAFMTNLQAMSLLALLVGIFLIYNAMSFSVLQRRRLIGLLRSLGVTRREVLLLIISEALLIGIVASLLGLVLGTLLGQELLWLVSRSINDLYFKVAATDVSVDQWSIIKGLLAGVLTSLFAAFLPAIEASSYTPNRALTLSDAERSTGRSLPWITGIGIFLMFAAGLLLLVSGRSLLTGLIALFVLILGFAFCIPILVRITSNGLSQLTGGAMAGMAVRGISASLSRTGVAIVALTVAVSATIGVTLMVDSFRGSVSRWLDTALQAEIYVGARQGIIDEALRRQITQLPAVSEFSTSQRITLETDSGRFQIQVIDMAPGAYAGTELLDGDASQVWSAWESSDAILVSEPFAYRNELGRGDLLRIPTDSGDRDFQIVSRFQSYDVNATGIMMSRNTFNRYFLDRDIESLGLYLAEPSRANEVVQTLKSLGGESLQVNSTANIRVLSLEVFDQTFAITDVLYWLAVIVAVIGILSSMLALQLEKTREHGILRALGTTPWQIARLIQTQTACMGLMSGVAAIPLGVAMAYILIEVINRRAFGWQIDLMITPMILLKAIGFAVFAAVVAGLYPAYRAASIRPAQAMRNE